MITAIWLFKYSLCNEIVTTEFELHSLQQFAAPPPLVITLFVTPVVISPHYT